MDFIKAAVASLFNFVGCTFLLFAIPFGLWFGIVAMGGALLGAYEFAGGASQGVGIAAIFWVVATVLIFAAYFLVRKQRRWILVLVYTLPIPCAIVVYANVGTLEFFSAMTGGSIDQSTAKQNK